MRQQIEQVQQAVSSWPGMTASPHRFGGLEFNLGTVEVGHIHLNGMVDIPFNTKIRNQLVKEGSAEPHHLLKDTGWITFFIHSDTDVPHAIQLFRISYLFNASRANGRAILKNEVDLSREVSALDLNEPLRSVVNKVILRGEAAQK
ncbi:MAG: DUF5519 family protein [Anaerolineae bacterium]